MKLLFRRREADTQENTQVIQPASAYLKSLNHYHWFIPRCINCTFKFSCFSSFTHYEVNHCWLEYITFTCMLQKQVCVQHQTSADLKISFSVVSCQRSLYTKSVPYSIVVLTKVLQKRLIILNKVSDLLLLLFLHYQFLLNFLQRFRC